MNLATVGLVAEDEVVEFRAERGGDTPAVLRHVGVVVADVKPEVQALVDPHRHAACPSRHDGIHGEIVEGRPSHRLQSRRDTPGKRVKLWPVHEKQATGGSAEPQTVCQRPDTLSASVDRARPSAASLRKCAQPENRAIGCNASGTSV